MYRQISRIRCLGMLAALGATCGAGPLAAQPEERDPVVPKAELPAPNGWDFFVKAAQSVHGGPGGTPSSMKAANDPAADLALQRGYVAQNGEAFRLLHEGFRYPTRRPRSDDLPFGPNARLRELGRLMMQKSRVAVADGRLDEAAEACLDDIQLGVASARGATLIGALTGTAIESMGRGELKTVMPRLNAAQLRQAAQRLESIETARTAYVDVLTEDKWSDLARLQAILAEPQWKAFRAARPDDAQFKGLDDWTREQTAQLKSLSDRQIMLNYVRAMDERIVAARLPFTQQPDPKTPHADVLSDLMIGASGTKSHRVSLERSATANALLIAQLALQAYRADNGHYPDTLPSLAPRYVQRAPLDPFDPATPLRYRRDGDGYVLYSVGPDGVDDGGQAIDNKPPLVEGTTEAMRRRILPQSKGDVLADVLK